MSAGARVEAIGRCEWCGLVDHHLVGGECAACRRWARTAADRVAPDEYATLGAEADVSHAIAGTARGEPPR